MFKKKKQKEFKKKLLFKKEKEKKSLTPFRIKEKDDYAVLEPFDLSRPKKTFIKEKIKAPEKVKPKLIIQKIEPKEVKSPIKRGSTMLSEKHPKPGAISKIPLNNIETDIDKLMEIIDEKKVVSIDYLSKTLKISVERLESWAKLLEDRGLIEIEYPIIGLPKLRKKEWKKKS